MSIDLTPLLLDAARHKDRWSPAALRSLLEGIQQRFSLVDVDWETSAGKEWAHLLTNGEVLGVLHAVLPLGLFVRGVDDRVVDYASKHGLFVTTAPAYDEPYYAVDPRALSTIFPDAALWPDHFPTSDLSIHDIYYATV